MLQCDQVLEKCIKLYLIFKSVQLSSVTNYCNIEVLYSIETEYSNIVLLMLMQRVSLIGFSQSCHIQQVICIILKVHSTQLQEEALKEKYCRGRLFCGLVQLFPQFIKKKLTSYGRGRVWIVAPMQKILFFFSCHVSGVTCHISVVTSRIYDIILNSKHLGVTNDYLQRDRLIHISTNIVHNCFTSLNLQVEGLLSTGLLPYLVVTPLSTGFVKQKVTV